MFKYENLPFAIGTTYFDGQTPDTTVATQLEGKVYEVEDLDYSQTGAKPQRTNRYRRLMVVRNVAAAALLPKYAVTFKVSGLLMLGQVDGYSRTTAVKVAGVVDEFLPAAGAPVNDLFYICIDGPAMMTTPLEANANNVFNVGDIVVALTAATSGATTSGRPVGQDLTGATALLGAQIQNQIGMALSAKTTANTNADILVNLHML